MHRRTLALALALVTALIGTAALPVLGLESPAPSPSPSAEATFGETDDLALVGTTALPDELATDLTAGLGTDLLLEPLALDLPSRRTAARANLGGSSLRVWRASRRSCSRTPPNWPPLTPRWHGCSTKSAPSRASRHSCSPS